LVVLANVPTALLDWTNTGYPIVQISKNGSAGPTGSNGLSAITAYLSQSQASSPPATPSNTTGATAPSGWSLTAPSVVVGNVLWYTFGQYNSSSGTINGIPAGQTQWGTPTAASIFQDIRSDNWNGSTPPTYGSIGTYGSTGYYIERTTGDCYFNNGVFRGDINTSGQGLFRGSNNSSYSVLGFNVYSSVFGNSPTTGVTGQINSGTFGVSQSTGTNFNIGAIGYATNSTSIGVYGYGNSFGGYMYSPGATALIVDGSMQTTSSNLVSNLYAQFSQSMVGTGGSNQLRFVSGTSTGSGVASFVSTNKPGGTTSNAWMTIQIDATTLYIPVWT
jgi:hypothetical protein